MEELESTLSQDALPLNHLSNCSITTASELTQENSVESENVSSVPSHYATEEEQDQLVSPGLPPPPPDNWHFNFFLDDIAERLTTEELEKLKFYLSGHDVGGIGKRALDEIKTPLQLFTILKTRGFLSRDNLIYLQKFLLQLKRKDLVKRAIDYANTKGNVIYFYTPSEQPENGYKFIRVHVEGQNFKNCKPSFVQELRNRTAAILFIPPEFVSIAGVEPSSSLLVTMMMPSMYADLIRDVLESNEYNLDFSDLGIDIIDIDGKQYNLKGISDADIVETDQQQKLANVYQRLEFTVKQLENSEVERLRLESELMQTNESIKKLEKEHLSLSTCIAVLEEMFVSTCDGKEPASLASQSALREFKNVLDNQAVQNYDKQILRSLINANTAVVVNRMRDDQILQQRQLQLVVADLRSQLFPLQLEIEKYKLFSVVDIMEMDRKLLDSFRKLLEMHQVTVEVQIMEPFLQILKTISRRLNATDKDKLSKRYTWKPEEELKQMVDGDNSFFLAGILHKEIQQGRQMVEPDKFISQCLKDIGRTDLLGSFKTMCNKVSSARKPATKKGRAKPDAKKGEKESAENTARICKIEEQIQKIYDMLNDTSKLFSPSKYVGFPPPYSAHKLS